MTSGRETGGSSPAMARVTYLPGVVAPGGTSGAAGRKTSAVPDLPATRGMPATRDVFVELPPDPPANELPDRTGGSFEREATFLGGFGEDEDVAGASSEDGETTLGEQRRAENVSMAALTRRGQSRWELEKTLVSRELDPEIVEAELDRLESVGLIDDAALAETVVRVGRERKGLGRGALVAELRRRHIDQEQIDAALDTVDDAGELAMAIDVAERRARQLRSLDHATAVRRLTGYMLRKGYPSSTVRRAVDEALPGPAGRRNDGGVRFS